MIVHPLSGIKLKAPFLGGREGPPVTSTTVRSVTTGAPCNALAALNNSPTDFERDRVNSLPSGVCNPLAASKDSDGRNLP